MVTAADLMTTDVMTVKPDTLVTEVAGIILKNKITALPVVDDDRRLQGIVSEGDLIRSAEARRDADRSWWLTLLTSTTSDLKDVLGQGERRVEEVMSRDVLLISERDGLKKLVSMLSRRQIKQLPVVRDGKLVGIVSRIDILRYLAGERVEI
ncbi:MAG: CBS domain-containing protein [Pseudomonadota bacterium]